MTPEQIAQKVQRLKAIKKEVSFLKDYHNIKSVVNYGVALFTVYMNTQVNLKEPDFFWSGFTRSLNIFTPAVAMVHFWGSYNVMLKMHDFVAESDKITKELQQHYKNQKTQLQNAPHSAQIIDFSPAVTVMLSSASATEKKEAFKKEEKPIVKKKK